eukprot:CAMPEP_0184309518 /NCGR_PEP_ID=MMETSP1049-20130417/17656_1 /TAXON_ID=77928 /ORGANISM="Proteomonas sulcata, Strain CCMP704" /LENGTH=106 /DNA_ID=CAMNT_0026622409 /DNA_START=314 /DNA_END=631 /DNA_ORIENTATION=-
MLELVAGLSSTGPGSWRTTGLWCAKDTAGRAVEISIPTPGDPADAAGAKVDAEEGAPGAEVRGVRRDLNLSGSMLAIVSATEVVWSREVRLEPLVLLPATLLATDW